MTTPLYKKADSLIAKRQADDFNDWRDHLPAMDRGVYDAGRTLKAVGVVLLCIGVPAGILAISIRPQPVQKRPPKSAA